MGMITSTLRRLDPRVWQIASLSALLFYGVTSLQFDVSPGAIALIVGSALATQLAFTRFTALPQFEPKSALISALSLCLLLRSDSPLVLVAGSVIAIGSKFLIRHRGKHIFNPTNIAIVALMASSNEAWISPGQWGSVAYFAFLISCAGMLVVYRAVRNDVTYAFLFAYLALVFGRAIWLGDPMAIPLLKLQNGALLLFAFFMISDPKTTPDSRAGRILFAVAVAALGWWIQAKLWRSEGLLFSLALLSPLVPLIDRLLPGEKYEWQTAEPSPRLATVHQLSTGGVA